MRRVTKVYSAFVIVISMVIQGVIVWGLKDDSYVMAVMAETEIQECETILKVEGTYTKGFLNERDINDLKLYISENMNIFQDNIEINSDGAKQYISIIIVFEGINEVLGEYLDRMDTFVMGCGFNTKSSIVIKGEMPGSLNQEKVGNVSENIFNKLNARKVTQIHDEQGNTFIYGYANGLKSSILCENEKVNVSIAFTYDETKGVTIIYVATPVLNIDI